MNREILWSQIRLQPTPKINTESNVAKKNGSKPCDPNLPPASFNYPSQLHGTNIASLDKTK